MERRLQLLAYAKINLGLKILGRREDGYHLIETLYQRIDLHDIVTLTLTDSEDKYIGPRLTESWDDNLCWKAVRKFREIWKGEWGVNIELDKRIPLGAGLGGGSSDAATVLKGLAQLTGIPLNHPQLRDLGVCLGADVNFFLNDLYAAYAQGIGEVLYPSKGLRRDLWVIIIVPPYPISTAWAYREIDNLLTKKNVYINIDFCEMFSEPEKARGWEGGNDFEPLVFRHYPELEAVKRRLKEEGAIYSGLTGSGSGVLGIFDDEVTARVVVSQWQPPWRCFLCRPF